MPIRTLVKADQIADVTAAVGMLAKDAEFKCDTPFLQSIFGGAPLGIVLVLAVSETTNGLLVDWQ